jgi:hypothetical protein
LTILNVGKQYKNIQNMPKNTNKCNTAADKLIANNDSKKMNTTAILLVDVVEVGL